MRAGITAKQQFSTKLGPWAIGSRQDIDSLGKTLSSVCSRANDAGLCPDPTRSPKSSFRGHLQTLYYPLIVVPACPMISTPKVDGVSAAVAASARGVRRDNDWQPRVLGLLSKMGKLMPAHVDPLS